MTVTERTPEQVARVTAGHRFEERVSLVLALEGGRWALDPAPFSEGGPLEGRTEGVDGAGCPCDDPDGHDAAHEVAADVTLPSAVELAGLVTAAASANDQAVTLTLSPDAVAVIAGLVAPTSEVNPAGINAGDAVWEEIRAAFALPVFKAWAARHPAADINNNDGKAYDPEGGY